MRHIDPDSEAWGGGDETDGAVELPPFVREPWGMVRRRWPWMLVALLLGLVATAVATQVIKPRFLATATLLITGQQIPEDFVRSTVREDTLENVNAMAGELLSRETVARMVEELELSPQPGETLFAQVTRIRSEVELSPQQLLPGRNRGGGNSMIVGIDFRSQDPEEAAAVANALASLFAEASVERRSSQAERTTSFLVRQLERDEEELRTQSQLVSEFRRQHRGELPSELDSNLRRLELVSKRRQTLLAQIAAAENRIATLEATAEKSENERLLESLRQQLANEFAANTEAHPNVIALRERIARLKEIVAEEEAVPGEGASREIASERRSLELLRSQLADAERAIEELSARIDRTPAVGEQLAVIEQKEKVLRDQYLASLRKVEDSELAESLERAQQGSRISVLDPASVPTSPEQPSWLIALGGTVGAVALAVALAVLLELVDPVVVTADQLEKLARGRCLGALPRLA